LRKSAALKIFVAALVATFVALPHYFDKAATKVATKTFATIGCLNRPFSQSDLGEGQGREQ
jgi:hypothetical protein